MTKKNIKNNEKTRGNWALWKKKKEKRLACQKCRRENRFLILVGKAGRNWNLTTSNQYNIRQDCIIYRDRSRWYQVMKQRKMSCPHWHEKMLEKYVKEIWNMPGRGKKNHCSHSSLMSNWARLKSSKKWTNRLISVWRISRKNVVISVFRQRNWRKAREFVVILVCRKWN